MRCWECRLELDEFNESQPVCPGCGQPPRSERDHPDFSGAFDEPLTPTSVRPYEDEQDDSSDAATVLETTRLPLDLWEAADDAESPAGSDRDGRFSPA